MAESDNREPVMVLTDNYRILGEMRRGPDGTLWDFKHRAREDFITVYGAQCFHRTDGKRMYDASVMELNRQAVVALFRQADLAFVRKEMT